jgi:hypothetical protein
MKRIVLLTLLIFFLCVCTAQVEERYIEIIPGPTEVYYYDKQSYKDTNYGFECWIRIIPNPQKQEELKCRYVDCKYQFLINPHLPKYCRIDEMKFKDENENVISTLFTRMQWADTTVISQQIFNFVYEYQITKMLDEHAKELEKKSIH